MTGPTERANIIDKINVPADPKLSEARKTELRKIAKEIAGDPNFIAKELARTQELAPYANKETGQLGGNIVGSLELNPGSATREYSKFLTNALEGKHIADYITVNQKIGKHVVPSEADNPEAAYVYALLSESHEKVLHNEKGPLAKLDIPSGYHPSLMMASQAPTPPNVAGR